MMKRANSLCTNLYFVRHAHSTYTPDELGRPLSGHGFIDANKVTELLKNENINHIISSPYQRSIQTVEGTAGYFEKKIEIKDGFRERMLAGTPVDDFPGAINKVWKDWHFSFPGGESNATAQKRGVQTTFDVLEKYTGENIVIGTHGNIMVLIMNYFAEQFDFKFWQELEMPAIYRLIFEGKRLVEVVHLK